MIRLRVSENPNFHISNRALTKPVKITSTFMHPNDIAPNTAKTGST